ncbi:MAG: hypothetical protein ACM3KR_11140 [Deltaproteobacteria bacterium]
MESSNKKNYDINSTWKISREPCKKSPEFIKKNILENMISIYFPKCKPFAYESKHTEWWKINNHHLLKRIFSHCGLQDIAPSGSFLHDSYYIYGYYIIGIICNNDTNHLIYGIPALYGIDVKPYFVNCCWKSENNTGELYGEFGYWLIENEIRL